MLIFSEKICRLAEFQIFHKEPGYLEFRPNAQLLLQRGKQTLPLMIQCALKERMESSCNKIMA